MVYLTVSYNPANITRKVLVIKFTRFSPNLPEFRDLIRRDYSWSPPAPINEEIYSSKCEAPIRHLPGTTENAVRYPGSSVMPWLMTGNLPLIIVGENNLSEATYKNLLSDSHTYPPVRSLLRCTEWCTIASLFQTILMQLQDPGFEDFRRKMFSSMSRSAMTLARCACRI